MLYRSLRTHLLASPLGKWGISISIRDTFGIIASPLLLYAFPGVVFLFDETELVVKKIHVTKALVGRILAKISLHCLT